MSQPGPRSVKIGSDERTGWSSDRPRKTGDAPPRPASVAVRGRTLTPSDRLRYTPGSLVVVASADPTEAERFFTRVLEDKAALLSPAKVRRLLEGRVSAEQLETQAAAVLEAAVAKRLKGGDAVVIVMEGFDPAEREHYVRAAAALRRPRHLVLFEGPAADDEDRSALDDLRRTLLAGELGEEGFHTAIRLGGKSAAEVNRLLFRAPARDD
jgi:hypothetical protein